MPTQEFGEQLRRLRETRRLTQEELAEQAGLHRVYIAQVETGVKSNPTFDTLRRLAAALMVPMSELVGKGRIVLAVDRPSPAEIEAFIKRAAAAVRRVRRRQERTGRKTLDAVYSVADHAAQDLVDRLIQLRPLIPSQELCLKALLAWLLCEAASISMEEVEEEFLETFQTANP